MTREKSYCLYCAHCHDGDALYCNEYDKVLHESTARNAGHCRRYTFIDVNAITGKPKRRRRKIMKDCNGQMSLFDKETKC